MCIHCETPSQKEEGNHKKKKTCELMTIDVAVK
jgi:hypothetical protein